MNRLKSKCAVIFSVFLLSLIVTPDLQAMFYKYRDKSGKLFFVDDRSKIPPEYLENAVMYDEKTDSMSRDEKAALDKEEQEIAEQMAREELDEEIKQRQLEAIKKLLEAQEAKKKYHESLETKVRIENNQVLVPVTIGYGVKEMEALLLLDTGSTIIVIYQDIADQLDVKLEKLAKARVVGGKLVNANLVVLNHIDVGPVKMKNPHAIVIEHRGQPIKHDGLLGMNFLRRIGYSVDYEKQTIRWEPQ